METPETDVNATERAVWNAGENVGARRALEPKHIGRFDFSSMSAADCVTAPSLTLRSTESCVAATLRGLGAIFDSHQGDR